MAQAFLHTIFKVQIRYLILDPINSQAWKYSSSIYPLNHKILLARIPLFDRRLTSAVSKVVMDTMDGSALTKKGKTVLRSYLFFKHDRLG